LKDNVIVESELPGPCPGQKKEREGCDTQIKITSGKKLPKIPKTRCGEGECKESQKHGGQEMANPLNVVGEKA